MSVTTGAVLFDLDGTLVDSLPDLHWAVNALLAEIGRPPVEAGAVRRWIGDGAMRLIERALAATGGMDGQPVADLLPRFLALYRGHLAIDSRLFPGVEATVSSLGAAGYRLGVCTNKPTDLAVELLRSLRLFPYFKAIVGGDGAGARKPHPDHIHRTLAAMGGTGQPAVMVGDSANDVAAARGAGLPVVVVGFGYGETAPSQLGGDLIIDDFRQLPDALARCLGAG